MAIYLEIYSGPARNYSTTSAKKKYIAIHNTSNNATAEAEASYARRRTDSVSSHYYVDDNSIVQSLDTKHKAWHAGSSEGNTYAIAYEIVGTNFKSRDWWLKNVDWDKLGKQIAKDMKLWGIANRRLSVSEARTGSKTGIVSHDDMRRAWGGTTHNDPGPNFPWDKLHSSIEKYLNPQPVAVEPEPVKEKEMYLVKVIGQKAVYITDGLQRRWVQNPDVLKFLRFRITMPEAVAEVNAEDLELVAGPLVPGTPDPEATTPSA